MLSLSYTVSPQIRDLKLRLDSLRSELLLALITPQSLLRMRWETKINRIYGSIALDFPSISKTAVENQLLSSVPSSKPAANNQSSKELHSLIAKYKLCLDTIEQDWLLSPKPISLKIVEYFWSQLYPDKKRSFKLMSPDISDLLNLLQARPEHPFISAGIAQIQCQLISQTYLEELNGLFARVLSYLVLYQRGFDIRRLVFLEHAWTQDMHAYQSQIQTTYAYKGLNPWLEYFLSSAVESLSWTLSRLESRPQTDLPQAFFELTDRQKAILSLLDYPGTTVTNRTIQKKFQVSQITASRDLSRLASLGLIFTHGKGRSVYYTKV